MAFKSSKQVQQDWKNLSQKQKDAIMGAIKILQLEKDKYDNRPVNYYIDTLLLLTIDNIDDFLVEAWEIVENLDCPELTQPKSQQNLMDITKSALVLVEALNNKNKEEF
jgi:hypothetical protein